MLFYIIFFIIFSFIGWIIDSTYTSLESKKFVNTGYFKGPFCPIYGFGSLFLIIFFNTISLPFWALILIASFLMTVLEFIGGRFSRHFLGVVLWDYSGSRFNYKGDIELLHSLYWPLLVAFFYFILYPIVLNTKNLFNLNNFIDFSISFVILLMLLYFFLNKLIKSKSY